MCSAFLDVWHMRQFRLSTSDLLLLLFESESQASPLLPLFDNGTSHFVWTASCFLCYIVLSVNRHVGNLSADVDVL